MRTTFKNYWPARLTSITKFVFRHIDHRRLKFVHPHVLCDCGVQLARSLSDVFGVLNGVYSYFTLMHAELSVT